MVTVPYVEYAALCHCSACLRVFMTIDAAGPELGNHPKMEVSNI